MTSPAQPTYNQDLEQRLEKLPKRPVSYLDILTPLQIVPREGSRPPTLIIYSYKIPRRLHLIVIFEYICKSIRNIVCFQLIFFYSIKHIRLGCITI